jgi:hypothetical protein
MLTISAQYVEVPCRLQLWHVDGVGCVCSLAVVAGAVPGEGDSGETARSGPEAGGGAPPVRRLRGRRQRPARPRTALDGAADPHQRHHLGGPAAEGCRRRRRRGLAVAVAMAGRRLLLASLVLAAAERAGVVRRRAHTGLTALRGGGRCNTDGLAWRAGSGGGKLDTVGGGGAVVWYRKNRPAGPTGSRRRH